MNKTYILLIMSLIILLSSFSFISAQECILGKDGYCDPNCVTEDFDCPNNPYQEHYFYTNENQFNPFEYDEEIQSDSTITPGSQNLENDYVEIIKEPKKISLLFYILGFLFLILISLVLYLIHHRLHHSQKEYNKQIHQLSNYVHNLQEQGYTKDQIYLLFKQKHYDEKTIRLVFKETLHD